MKCCLPYLLALCLSAMCFTSQAQEDVIQKLQRRYSTTRTTCSPCAADTSTIRVLDDLAWELLSIGAYDSCIKYVFIGVGLCDGLIQNTFAEQKKQRFPKLYKAALLNTAGIAYNTKTEFIKALEIHESSLKIKEELNHTWGIAASLNNIGQIYWKQCNYPKALSYYFKTLKIYEGPTNDPDLIGHANTLNNIALIYNDQNDHKKSLDYHFRALAVAKKAADKNVLSTSYNNIGLLYGDMDEIEKAMENYLVALKLREEVQDRDGIATSLNNIGNLYKEKKEYKEALSYLQRSLNIAHEIKHPYITASSCINIGQILYAQKENAAAFPYYFEALKISEESELPDLLKAANFGLSKLYTQTGDHFKALAHYKAYIAARNKIFNEENTKKTVQAEMNFEFEKKEAAALIEQEKKEVMALAEKKKQQIILLVISGFGLLVLGFAIFAYRSFLQKKKTNIEISHQKHLIEEKQKEILDSIYYARRIQRSLVTSERYIQKNLIRLRS